MNDLVYVNHSKAGNQVYAYYHDGFAWLFERVSDSDLVLHDIVALVECVDETKYDVGMKLEELPSPIRREISNDPRFRLRSRVTSAEEAMSA